MKVKYRSTRRAVFSLTVHIVLVTKYRRKIITHPMLEELQKVFESVLSSWDSELIECNGESDHAHLIVSYPPHKLLSSLIANLKATSSKTMWRKFEREIRSGLPTLNNRARESVLSKVYFKKRVFWTGSYFVSSCGGVTIDVLKGYVQNQDSPPKP